MSGEVTVCAACGAPQDRPHSTLCSMSDDGEGPHDWVYAPTKLSAADREYLRRLAIHYDQGEAER